VHIEDMEPLTDATLSRTVSFAIEANQGWFECRLARVTSPMCRPGVALTLKTG
jgi:hypothetical protein